MSFEKSRTWALIHLSNFENNIRVIKNHIGEQTKIMAVVKADAYGHGAVEIAKEALSCEVDYLAVACMDEAKVLRKAEIDAPILILSHSFYEQAEEIIRYDIMPTIFNLEFAKKLNEYAALYGGIIKAHIKIDTGMTRLGFDALESKTIDEIKEISIMSHLQIEGIYTHFADSDNENDEGYTKMQYDRFSKVLEDLEKIGVQIPIKHACNSAAAITNKEMHLDMVRCGIIIYGYYPSKYLEQFMPGLLPVMEVQSSLTQVRAISKDVTVSYGRTFKTIDSGTIGVVSIGYADGMRRLLSNRFYVLICGKKAPIIGRVCMDQLIVDLTNIPEAEEGNKVVIIGKDAMEAIWADDMADALDTISYEVLCDITSRVPRVYFKENKEVRVLNYLDEKR